MDRSFLQIFTPGMRNRQGFKPALAAQLLAAMIFISPLIAQEAKPASTNAGQKPKTVESPMKVSGIRYVSGNRRDPFLNPLLIKKTVKPDDEELSRGVPPPGIAGTYIEQAVLQGISTGEGRKMAIVRGADTRAYFLKEGDRLFDGYLKTIGIDFITLVRETNMRSGKTITQEVTKRLRTP
jgi:hypothetical protein